MDRNAAESESLNNKIKILQEELNRLLEKQSELEQVIAKLRLQEDEWEKIFNSITEMVALIDKDHRVVRINQSFASALKINPDDALGKHCYEIVHGTKSPLWVCPHTHTIATQEKHSAEFFDERLQLYLRVTTSPLFSAEGEFLGSVHLVYDVTGYKMSEQELTKKIEALERFQRITVDRELRMKELKAELAKLKLQLSQQL